MLVNWPGMIRPRVKGLFLLFKEGLRSKHNDAV